MPMLDATDVADLRTVFTDAQTDYALVLYRYNNGSGLWDELTAQNVQVALAARQAISSHMPGIQTLESPLTFYREAPFNVVVGDTFAYDGHKGGKVTRVFTEPVLGVIAAEATLDEGR